MALAVLSIDLEARLAKFEADMGRASRSLDKLAANAKSSFATVGNVFAGSVLASAAEEAVRGLLALFPQLIEGVAAFQDLAEETGASAAALAQFQTAADVSGVTVQDLAGLMVKLTGNLTKVGDESKGAGAALKALGIPLAEFKALAPDEQIKRLAGAFDQFAEGSGRTAVALALFGKSGAQVLKFFNEYTNGVGANTKLTAEMIEMADRWGDAQAKSRSELTQTAQVIAVQSLPALTALTDGFKEAARATLGLNTATSDLTLSNSLLDWAEAGAIAITTVGESIAKVVKGLQAFSGSIGVVMTDVKFLDDVVGTIGRMGPNQQLPETIERLKGLLAARNDVLTQANERYVRLWNDNGTAASDAIRKSFERMRQSLDPSSQRELARFKSAAAQAAGEKPSLTFNPPDKDGEARDKAFQSFLANLEKQDALAQAQLDNNGKLSESDRRRIELLTDLTDASKGFTLAQQLEGEAAVAAYISKLKQFELDQDLAKTRKATADLEDRAVAARSKDIESLIATNQALADQVEEVGLAGKALEALRVKRLENIKAQETEVLLTLQNAGASEAEIAAQERKIALLERQIGLRGRLAGRTAEVASDPVKGATDALDAYLAKIQESGTATREVVGQSLSLLEDDLTASLAKGRVDLSRTIDYMISEFLRLQVVKPLLNSLFSSLGSGGGSFLAKLFGFADGGAFAGGRPIAFASGGIVDSPHLFKFAGGTGLMGEAGPEAVMPLKRGPGGKLGVVSYGGGGGSTINVVQHVTIQSGVSANEVMAAMEQSKRAAISAIYDAQRRGREVV